MNQAEAIIRLKAFHATNQKEPFYKGSKHDREFGEIIAALEEAEASSLKEVAENIRLAQGGLQGILFIDNPEAHRSIAQAVNKHLEKAMLALTKSQSAGQRTKE